MIVSERKKNACYKVISEDIMDLRIKLVSEGSNKIDVDEELFRLEIKLWATVCETLNIE